ncbi:hypothetical protein niasHS_006490 [Heterodera schachtii]|uniref:Uncharacterized protein n=1 Tax=Heterodera schachtii TaxID=97005 RepID=A0ABD2JHU5_HETSC
MRGRTPRPARQRESAFHAPIWGAMDTRQRRRRRVAQQREQGKGEGAEKKQFPPLGGQKRCKKRLGMDSPTPPEGVKRGTTTDRRTIDWLLSGAGGDCDRQ